MEKSFMYGRAVVCSIPDSLPAAALRLCEPKDPVDLQKARLQHQQYVEALKARLAKVGLFLFFYSQPVRSVLQPAYVLSNMDLVTVNNTLLSVNNEPAGLDVI